MPQVSSLTPQACARAEGKGVEPSSLDENRVSSAAQQTVSGYLPKQASGIRLQTSGSPLRPDS